LSITAIEITTSAVKHTDAGLYKSKTAMRIFRVAKCDTALLGLGWGLELEALAFSLSTLAFTKLTVESTFGSVHMSTATSVRLRSALWRRLASDCFPVKHRRTAVKLEMAA
jgi:hypothetical protein